MALMQTTTNLRRNRMDPYVPEFLRRMKKSRGIGRIIFLVVAIPVLAVVGMLLLLSRRRRKGTR